MSKMRRLAKAVMPGDAPPKYLNISSDHNPRILCFGDATAEDLAIAAAKRWLLSKRVGHKACDFELKSEWIRANRVRADETIGEISARLKRKRSQAHTPDHIQEHYMIERDGKPMEVQLDDLTDEELEAKIKALDAEASAHAGHADELRRYVVLRGKPDEKAS